MNPMTNDEKCICKEEIPVEIVYVHLSWCPQSYVYKEDMMKYNNAPFWRKLFTYNPKKHPHGY